MKLGNVGPEVQRVSITGDGLVRPAKRPVDGSQVGVEVGPVGKECQRPTEKLQGHVVLSPLVGQDTQPVQSVGMGRIGVQICR